MISDSYTKFHGQIYTEVMKKTLVQWLANQVEPLETHAGNEVRVSNEWLATQHLDSTTNNTVPFTLRWSPLTSVSSASSQCLKTTNFVSLLKSGPTIILESDCCRQSVSLSMKSFHYDHYAEPQHSSTFQLKNPLVIPKARSNWPSNLLRLFPVFCYPLSTTKRLIPSESSALNWQRLHLYTYSIFTSVCTYVDVNM